MTDFLEEVSAERKAYVAETRPRVSEISFSNARGSGMPARRS